MCGIVGILYRNIKSQNTIAPIGKQLINMLDALGHRGVDSTGVTVIGEPIEEDFIIRLWVDSSINVVDAVNHVEKTLKNLDVDIKHRSITENFIRLTVNYKDDINNLTKNLVALPGIIIHSIGNTSEVIKDVGDAQDLDNKLNTLGFSKASLNQQKARVEFMRFLAYAQNQQKEEAYSALNARKSYSAAAMALMEVDEVIQRNFDFVNARNEAWYHILFGEYDKAEEQLTKLYSIASKIQSPFALDSYNALSGMVRLFSGDAQGALSYFNDNIIPENYLYYGYFKGLALKGAGENTKAEEIFNYIANYNFSGWGEALVRSLAIKQLES